MRVVLGAPNMPTFCLKLMPQRLPANLSGFYLRGQDGGRSSRQNNLKNSKTVLWIEQRLCGSCKCFFAISSHYITSTTLQLSITLKVINGLYPGVTTVELDTLAAETAATMTIDHPDYAILAARIAVSNLHKETKKHFTGNYYSNNPLIT